MKRIALLWPAFLLMAGQLFGQELPLLDLEACLRELLGAGPGIAALERSQAAARAQLRLAAARIEPALAAEATLSGKEGFGEAGAFSAIGGASLGLGGEGSGSLVFSSPLTELAFTASQSLPSAESGSSPATRLGLSLTQAIAPAYPGGAAQASYDKSLLGYRGKELQAEQDRAKALAAAKKAYVALLGAQRARELASTVGEQQSRLLLRARALRALGEATELELKRAELKAREKALDLEEAELALRSARRALALLIGRPPESEFRAADLPDPSLPARSLGEALEIGLTRRVGLSDLELQRKAAEIDLALARAQAAPSLSLKAGASVGFRGGVSPSQAALASASILLDLPLLDGGAYEAQSSILRAQIEALNASSAELRLSIAAEIAAAYDGAALKGRRAELAADQAELAQAELALVDARFGFGAASLEDRLDAQDAAAAAQSAGLKAGNDYLLAVFALETAMGL